MAKSETSSIRYTSTMRCDICGRYVSIEDLEAGLAKRYLLYPDAEGTKETYETYHVACDEDAKNGLHE